jgi:hypothetical protein
LSDLQHRLSVTQESIRDGELATLKREVAQLRKEVERLRKEKVILLIKREQLQEEIAVLTKALRKHKSQSE